jgi:hypothetical protein
MSSDFFAQLHSGKLIDYLSLLIDVVPKAESAGKLFARKETANEKV